MLLASAPLLERSASADLPGERIDLAMYGRVGVAWGLTSPQIIQGQSMNLTDHSIGGRFEEGDYLEPTLKVHVMKPDHPNDTAIDMVMTPAMFARNGSFIGAFSNGAPQTLGIELFQGYIEATNVFVPGLSFWGGARFYRGADVHIADYFYFNNLTAQGGGAKYKGLDVAVLVHTATQGSSIYNIDTDNDTKADIERLRTILVGQYVHKFGKLGSSLHGLAELHVVPSVKAKGSVAADPAAPADYGWVLGAKAHLDFDNGNFNDTSVRFGSRIANGALGGDQTFNTFGLPDPIKKTYDGALGLEVVEHFLVNFGTAMTLNGYGTLHYDKGASGAPKDKAIDFAVGARTLIYAHKNFHMVNELTFQGRKNGDDDMGTAVKFSVVPTIVPSGKSIAWARPHMRLIYTAAFYNQASVDQKLSPYLRNVSDRGVGHYLGARTEWWF